MTGHQLKNHRKKSGLTQVAASRALGVSQTYLSLLENGDRPLNPLLEKRAVKVFGLDPTELPSLASEYKVAHVTDDQLTADLSALGYPGFSHYKPSRRKNPADVLLSALKADNRDARLMEAMPWLTLKFHEMDWSALVAGAKLYDLQNRLGFVTSVALGMAQLHGKQNAAKKLIQTETHLRRSRLDREDTLCNEKMTNAERDWLRTNRSDVAKYWHMLTSLLPEFVRYVD
ncbi:MAG: helix-turn-helix domain-containing protein [Pyrinomonadaceae bacterium]